MNYNSDHLEIIRPDDWHVHLREGEMLKAVIKHSSRINSRCIVMPNLKVPITTSDSANKYKKEIGKLVDLNNFMPLIPCYLTDRIDLDDFKFALKNNIFVGAKLYPVNTTTNSNFGVSNIENIYAAIEILIKFNKPLLIHGEKINSKIDLFDREKYFIDDELTKIIKNFPSLKIVLEHISSKYGADFVFQNDNLSGTITPHHMLLTKKDVFKETINAHHYCMPVVKEEYDLLALRKYACSGSEKFFIGTDSAPHDITNKESTSNLKPGIFSAPCSIELYAEIFNQEGALEKLENFTSINGPTFYNLPLNQDKIYLSKKEWIVEEFTIFNHIKVKNFFGGEKLNWKIEY